MSYVSLYSANNTKYNFAIGNCTPGGSYDPNTRNAWGFSGSMPSGVVGGVTVPSLSHYVNWMPWNENPPTFSEGTDFNSLSIGASSSLTLYTQKNSGGSSFVFTTDSNGKISSIDVHSGRYSSSFGVQGGGTTNRLYFVWVNGVGLSQFDNLCIFFELDDFYGDAVRGLHFGGDCSLNSVFTNSTADSIADRFASGSLIGVEPGNEGFVPIGDIADRVFGGGSVSGEVPGYTTDVLEMPGAPDESHGSAVRSGLINVYHITEANLIALGRALFGTEGVDGLITKLQNSFLNPLDAIISLQLFPCTPDLGSSEHIKVLDWSSYVDKLGTTSSGNKLASQYKTFNFGELSVAEMWQSYLDYDSTSFELYLPFIGSVDIPIAEVMNGSIKVDYTVDFLTGMCVGKVLCTKNVPLSNGRSVPQYSLHSYMGNCSVQIPLNNVSYGNIVGSLMQAASTGLRTGNAGLALASVVESGLSGGLQPTVKTKGTISANAGFCSCLYPYISVTRPITVIPESFQEIEGYPSYIYGKLSSYKGLCICDDIDLTGLSGATENELDEIRNICKSGIYV